MAYRRRRTVRHTNHAKRKSVPVRIAFAEAIAPDTLVYQDLLASAEKLEYEKDLTPAVMSSLRGTFTWWSPAASATAKSGYLGVGTRVESRRQIDSLEPLPAANKGMWSPLDVEGKYMDWHFRKVCHVVEPATSGYQYANQAALNTKSLSTRQKRSLRTVDDSYYLFADTQGLDETIFVSFEATLWLRQY